jgi:hypothetical protein
MRQRCTGVWNAWQVGKGEIIVTRSKGKTVEFKVWHGSTD